MTVCSSNLNQVILPSRIQFPSNLVNYAISLELNHNYLTSVSITETSNSNLLSYPNPNLSDISSHESHSSHQLDHNRGRSHPNCSDQAFPSPVLENFHQIDDGFSQLPPCSNDNSGLDRNSFQNPALRCFFCDEPISPNERVPLKCSHDMSMSCFYKYVSDHLDSRHLIISCPDINCSESPFSYHSLKTLIRDNSALVESFEQITLQTELLQLPDRFYCPTPDCTNFCDLSQPMDFQATHDADNLSTLADISHKVSTWFKPARSQKKNSVDLQVKNLRRFQCSVCNFSYCMLCKSPWTYNHESHDQISCEQFSENCLKQVRPISSISASDHINDCSTSTLRLPRNFHCPTPDCTNICDLSQPMDFQATHDADNVSTLADISLKVSTWFKRARSQKKNSVDEQVKNVRRFQCSVCNFSYCMLCKSPWTYNHESHDQISCEQFSENCLKQVRPISSISASDHINDCSTSTLRLPRNFHCPTPDCTNICDLSQPMDFQATHDADNVSTLADISLKVSTWFKRARSQKKNSVDEQVKRLRRFQCSVCNFSYCMLCKSPWTYNHESHDQISCEQFSENCLKQVRPISSISASDHINDCSTSTLRLPRNFHCPTPDCTNICDLSQPMDFQATHDADNVSTLADISLKVSTWFKRARSQKKNSVDEQVKNLRRFQCSVCNFSYCMLCKSPWTYSHESHDQISCEQFSENCSNQELMGLQSCIAWIQSHTIIFF